MKELADWFPVRGKQAKRYYRYDYSKNNHTELQSPEWKQLRERVIAHYRVCQLCGLGQHHRLQVHHRYYFRPPHQIWDYELEDLSLLCEDCHERVHHPVRT